MRAMPAGKEGDKAQMTTKRISDRISPAMGLFVLCLALFTVPGCYDADLLVAQARSNAASKRQLEVDLGQYYVSLPREDDSTTTVTLQMHVFANVPRREGSAVSERARELGHSLRHETILAVRQTDPQEFADPDLAVLRNRVTDVAKRVLGDTPIDSVGFYQFNVFEE